MVVDKSKDYIVQLAGYVQKNIAKGYTLDSLKISLRNQGYSRIAIEKAVEYANKELAEKAPKMLEKPTITYRAIPLEEDINKKDLSFFKKLIKRFRKNK